MGFWPESVLQKIFTDIFRVFISGEIWYILRSIKLHGREDFYEEKLITMLLSLVLAMIMLTGCTEKTEDANNGGSENTNSDEVISEEAPEEPTQKSETETNQSQESTATNETTESTDLNVNGDFKAIMDSYESFMNEYVDFMKKYENASDDEYLSMPQEYTEMMTQYANMTEKNEFY